MNFKTLIRRHIFRGLPLLFSVLLFSCNSEKMPEPQQIKDAQVEAASILHEKMDKNEKLKIIHNKIQTLLHQNELEKALAWTWVGGYFI